jgi:predicted flavoprotein YhiN
MQKTYKVAIIGGGFSGLICAEILSCKFGGQNVLLLERNDRVGKKILATGNGKCNFTNLLQEDSCYRGTDASFSKAARESFPMEQTLEFFKSIGIEPKIRNGYVYPNSEQAASVADALVMELRAKKVKVVLATTQSLW